jgi:flagellar hook-associated protein 3 FlgL
MRVTNNMLINNMVYNLNQNLRTLENLQYQKATGKKFRVPSDDPIGVSKSLKFNTDVSKLEQYQRNAKDAMSWMTDTEAALGEIGTVLHRANELTVDAANGTKKSPEDLQKIKEEIDQLREHLVQIANTAYAGRHVFSGYKTDKPLLDENGNYNTEGLPFKDSEVFEYNVGVSERVKVNTVGVKVFGKGDAKVDTNGEYKGDVTSGDKPYLISVFDDLSEALDGGDVDKIQSALTNIKNSHEQVLGVRAEVGAKMNRLELTEKKLGVQVNSVKELLSYNEDVDIAEITMHISTAENVYVSSLMIGAKVIQPTLVQFLG